MILFIIFIIWIAAISVAIPNAFDKHDTRSYVILMGLVLVFIIVINIAIFDPTLIGV